MALTDNLISYWKLDENAANTTVADSHGSNTGASSTNTSNLYEATGKINSAFDFNGSSEQVDTNFAADITTHSFSFWFKKDQANYPGSGEGVIFGSYALSPGAMKLGFHNAYPDEFYLMYYQDGSNYRTKYSIGLNIDENWHHVLLIFEGDFPSVYLDNVEVTNWGTDGTAGTPTHVNSGGDYYLGSRGGATYFDGKVDEFAVWSGALTSDERAELYNSGDGLAYPFAPPPPVVPTAEFSGTPLLIDEGDTVTFTDSSTETPTSWLWKFGDGIAGNQTVQNPTHTYLKQGYYTVTLTATNETGSDDEIKTNYITVLYPPRALTGTRGTKEIDKDYPLSDDSGLGNTQYHKDRTINLVAEESSNVSQKEMVLV